MTGMSGAAFGAIEMVQGALVFVLLVVAHKVGKRDGRQEHLEEMAERRSLRRIEQRERAYTARHQAAPWPGPDPDALATTGELRALAETGDVAEIRRLNAAWMRVFDLIGHARKTERESAA